MKKIIVGVGGIVIKENKVLLVRHTYGSFKGKWIIPGGHVEAGENIDDAILREIKEETSIEAEVKNIISVRSIVLPDGSSEIYIVFLLDYISGTPTPDNIENDAAEFFDIEKAIRDEKVVYLSRYLIEKVWRKNYNSLTLDPIYPFNNSKFKLFC
jgi:mutator protein MutT